MQRLVFDTSTLVGAVIRPKSIPRAAYDLATNKSMLVLCTATWDELEEVFSRAKFDRYDTQLGRSKFLTEYQTKAEFWAIDPQSELLASGACRDPKDDKFLALALAAKADAIVTSDDDLLSMRLWHGIEILTPAQWLMQEMAQ